MRKKGKDLWLVVNNIHLALARSYDFNADSEEIPLSQVQAGSALNSKQGRRGFTVFSENLITWDMANFKEVFSYYQQGTIVTIDLKDRQETTVYSGSGWVKSVRKTGAYRDMAKFTFLFIGTTEITETDLTAGIGEMEIEGSSKPFVVYHGPAANI